MPPTAHTAGDRRDELEYQTEQDLLGEVLGEFRQGWEIKNPPMWGEPWTAEPRRTGLPYVTGAGLTELRDRLRTEAKSAGLADILALEADFAGWRVWRSSHGAWWATRAGRLTLEMQDCGLHATVGDVRRAGELRVLLAEQAKLEAWAADHQWQVPGEQARRELGLPPEQKEFRSVTVTEPDAKM